MTTKKIKLKHAKLQVHLNIIALIQPSIVPPLWLRRPSEYPLEQARHPALLLLRRRWRSRFGDLWRVDIQ